MVRFGLGLLVGLGVGAAVMLLVRPPSAPGLALEVLDGLTARSAARAAAAYAAQQAEAQARQDALAAALTAAQAARLAAEARAAEAAGQAEAALAAVHAAETTAAEATTAVATAQAAVEAAPADLPAVRALVTAQADAITRLTDEVTTVHAALEASSRLVGLERAVSASLRRERQAALAQTQVLEERVTLASARIAALDGRRIRWGPGAAAGVTPIGGGRLSPALAVGLVVMWGR